MLNDLIQLRGKEMTIEELTSALENIDSDEIIQFNGPAIKFGKYFIRIESLSEEKNYHKTKVKILSIIDWI